MIQRLIEAFRNVWEIGTDIRLCVIEDQNQDQGVS